MNRRGFLSMLGLGAAGLALDPEKLLWTPGAKKIFIPSPHATLSILELLESRIREAERNIERVLTVDMFSEIELFSGKGTLREFDGYSWKQQAADITYSNARASF